MDGDEPGGRGFRGETVVVDTNVLVAALIPRRRHAAADNSSATLLRAFEAGEVRLCLSGAILAEYDHLAARMPLIDRPRYAALRRRFEARQGITWVTGELSLDWCNDPPDNRFLEAAAEGKAMALLTSDKQLLSTGPRAKAVYGFEVLPCRRFVASRLGPGDKPPDPAGSDAPDEAGR